MPTPQFNFNDPYFQAKRRVSPRGKYFFYLICLILAGMLLFRLGGAGHSVVVENRPWWKRVSDVLVSVSEIASSANSELSEKFPMPAKESWRQDILLLGIRGRKDTEGGLLSDSVILLSTDTKTDKVSLISLPRDLYANMPTVTKGKINEIYEKSLPQKDSLEFSRKAFSRLTGVYIDNIVVFDFATFKEVVDTLGGVDVYLTKPFEEKTQWGYPFTLPAGQNHLNGEQALYYARSRFSTNDFDRSRRQQEIILAIKKKVSSLSLIENPSQILALWGHFKNNVETDFDLWDSKKILEISSLLKRTDLSLSTKTVSTENLLYQTFQDSIYILLPLNQNWETFRQFFQNSLES